MGLAIFPALRFLLLERASSMCSSVGFTPRMVRGLFRLTSLGVRLTITVLTPHSLRKNKEREDNKIFNE